MVGFENNIVTFKCCCKSDEIVNRVVNNVVNLASLRVNAVRKLDFYGYGAIGLNFLCIQQQVDIVKCNAFYRAADGKVAALKVRSIFQVNAERDLSLWLLR